MKRILVLLAFSMLAAASANAQQYLRPKWDSCITENGTGGGAKIFNNCSIRLSVQAVSRDGSSAPWQIEINPGGWQMSGWGTQGYELYVCPSGYTAVDGDGKTFQTAITEFQCEKLY
jgi:hypothetical protein